MTWNIHIENIAGILDAEVEIQPGLTAVRGSNWQGKSSFIEGIKTALGVSKALTEGKRSGKVQLTTIEETSVIDLSREDGSVRREGEVYLDDEYDLVRTALFACLDERNDVRRAVREGTDLEEVLMRPLDVQNIEERLSKLWSKRERIESELSQAQKAGSRLPQVREQVTQLENEIESLREQRDAFAPPAADTDQESIQNRLSHVRAERDRMRSQINRLEHSLDRTEETLTEKRAELDSLSVPEEVAIESELTDARDQLQEVKRDIEVLRSVYSANQLVLNENRLDLLTEVEREVMDDRVICWICGNEATTDTIEDRLTTLDEKITARRSKAESYREKIETLEAKREEYRQARRRKQNLEGEIAELEETYADRETSLADARDRLEELETRVTELSESIDETVDEFADIEGKIQYRETELEEARDELHTLEERETRIETLESEYESCTEEIEALRNRKEELKSRARRAFDDAMQAIVERFDTGFESARLTPQFDLVVARDGHDASLDALSEGELELLGFIAALAGYESFDVDEIVPILLIDGVGSLADENLHTLINYLDGRCKYLVFTAYPEHEPFDGQEINPADWVVAHNQQTTTE